MLLLSLLLTGCAPVGGACDASSLAAGEVKAEVDGEAWTGAGARWNSTGDGIQVTTDASGGWRLTLVANYTAEGVAVGELLADEAFPIEVALGGDDGQALAYPDGGGSMTTQQGGSGLITLTGQDGQELFGCFAFDASGNSGDVSLSAGALRAPPLGG